MKHIFIVSIILMAITIIPLTSAKAECLSPIKTPFSAVSLLKKTFLGWINNENRLNEMCPTRDEDCITNALLAKIDKIPVYDHPYGKAIAHLEVTYAPRQAITVALIKEGKVFPFTPPIYDGDWGYGPWFHATLLDQNGVWKNIALPSIQNGWVELPEAEILQLTDTENVYSLKDRHIVILKSNETSLIIRDEQPADMWCEGGTPPPLTPFKKQTVLINQVYDDQCNLLLSIPYTRGC